jgi:hypothetical protein
VGHSVVPIAGHGDEAVNAGGREASRAVYVQGTVEARYLHSVSVHWGDAAEEVRSMLRPQDALDTNQMRSWCWKQLCWNWKRRLGHRCADRLEYRYQRSCLSPYVVLWNYVAMMLFQGKAGIGWAWLLQSLLDPQC